ncbi:MAG: methylmalonyl-CoA decarboxylase [Planctomycetaceae bacterium]|nr:methylmalonyl-CoA decarboxylase [Planctomycetaceae bacterium]
MLIQTSVREQVGTITLDHPARHNAIGRQLVDEFLAALDDLRRQEARVVVVRARPDCRVWSAGHDLDELDAATDPLASSATLDRLLRGVMTSPAPVIAMVHGSVWGGATDFVLSCDLVVGDSTAQFTMSAANLGLAYNLEGLRRFAARLPLHRVRELFFTATPVTAANAHAWGILNHLVPDAELEGFTYSLARCIASRAPLAIAAVKEQLRLLASGAELTPDLLAHVDELRRRAHTSPDFAEGQRAFREKRKPEFRGEH